MRRRALTSIVLILLSSLGGLAATTAARAAPVPPVAEVCEPAVLTEAKVSTWARLHHDGRTYTKIDTELSVEIPGDWPLAPDLLLSEDSRRYIAAMACLTMSDVGQQRRWSEWRTSNPHVSSKGGRVKVVYRSHSWVNRYQKNIDVGAWRIWAGADRWTVTLMPPPALAGARWEKITVDPGSAGAERATPRPTAGDGTTGLVWQPVVPTEASPQGKESPDAKQPREGRSSERAATGVPPEVSVSLKPSWQRSWAAQNDRLTVVALDRLGAVLWTSGISALLLMAVRRYRRRSGTPTAEQDRALRNIAAWALAVVLLEVFVRADDLVTRYGERSGDGWFLLEDWVLLGNSSAVAAITVLLGFAKPSATVWVASGVLAVPPFVVMTWTEGLGLPPSHDVEPAHLAVLAASSSCLLALVLLGCAAAAWRLAADGGLLPPSRRFPGSQRVLRLRWAGPVVGAATLAVGASFALTEERSWRRVSWLSNRVDPRYGVEHRTDWFWELTWSVSNAQDWILDYTWMITCVAMLAVLRTGRARSTLSPFEDGADRLMFLTFFPVAVTLVPGGYLDNALLFGLTIPLCMLALYGAASAAARRAVLAQPFERSGLPLFTSRGPVARRALLRKARMYREIHAELRRLDQGLFGDVPPKRKDLERELNDLHDWPASLGGSGPDRLPARVSVVDAALALGPRDDWWANGSRGARFALLPGVPASVLATWAWALRGEGWQNALSYLYGIPDLLLTFVFWMVGFVGAGFTLGALWRRLPGRRGAAKALPVALAFALPIGLDLLGLWFTRQSADGMALYALVMLFVLTVTGIALDLDTFQGERRYWQSRLGLLLSVYQMRYYSLQMAYLIAQLVAMVTIWEFFVEPDASPTKELTTGR
ncbi:DUF6185 family protein [Streptomyces sp. NPDC046324]|uniref:DUF6185 family protein n=1 Tax=Streptomyces sp. NPDC046324 TaxID=3154915 RepID=UPI0033D20450